MVILTGRGLFLRDLFAATLYLTLKLLTQAIKVNKSMKQDSAIKLFEEKKVRTHWDADTEQWFFSVIDVIEILTEAVFQNATGQT